MRIAVALAIVALLIYVEASAVAQFGVLILLGLSYIHTDLQDQGKKLTAIEDHSEQSRIEIERDLGETQKMGAQMLREIASISSRLHSLEVETELLRKHLVPDTRRPWDA